MKRLLIVSLALAVAPATVFAQTTTTTTTTAAPALDRRPPLTAAQRSAMQQLRAEFQQSRMQTRARLLAALTPAHRTAVANVVGQLALTTNPNPKAAAQALDAILAPAEKTSIVNIAAAERSNTQALMQQQRSIFEASMTADQKAQMAQRETQRQAYMASHPRTAHVPDPGAIVLRTLGSFGGPGYGMRRG